MKASVASSCIHIDAAAVPEPAARQNLAAGVSTTIEPESLFGPKIPCGSGCMSRLLQPPASEALAADAPASARPTSEQLVRSTYSLHEPIVSR